MSQEAMVEFAHRLQELTDDELREVDQLADGERNRRIASNQALYDKMEGSR